MENYPFPVHLSPEQIEASDEYAEHDPYSVEDALTGPFQRRRIDLTLALLKAALDVENARILDVGCGEGHITAEIQNAFRSAEIHAFDYSISAIKKAHQSFPGISFSVGDALNSPYPDGKFDVVVCNNLWEHVPDPIGLLMRMKGALKPHGYVIISTPSRYRTQNLFRAAMGKPVVMMSKHHVTEYTVGQVHEQLAYGGFEVVRAISRPNTAGPLKGKIAAGAIRMWRRLVGSHHELEATIFYLARS